MTAALTPETSTPALTHIDNPDVILIGSGIMSSTLGVILKRLAPNLSVQLYEATDELAPESSHGWNNSGTGHAGICELSYTPDRERDVGEAASVCKRAGRGQLIEGIES